MWHYNDANRFRQTGRPSLPGAQSTYDLLLAMRGTASLLIFLDLSTPDQPVSQVPGFIEGATTASIGMGLAAPLPKVDPRTRFGVEVLTGPAILRFQTTAHRAVELGATHIELALPRQIESVQRRKFSRAPMNVPVAFSTALGSPSEQSVQGSGLSANLSAGGMRLTTHIPLRYGQHLFVSFNSPDGAAFRGLAARVVRVQSNDVQYQVGLQFDNLGEQTEASLMQTVFRLQVRSPG